MRLTPTTAVAAATALIAGLLVTSAAPASADHRKVTIKVTELETSYDDTFGDTFPGPGDSFSFTSRLERNGKDVGSDKGRCVIKRFIKADGEPVGVVSRCKVTLTFDDKGKIKVKGSVPIDFRDDELKFDIPIVDGTGTYADAKGTLTNRQVSAAKSKLTLRFTVDD